MNIYVAVLCMALVGIGCQTTSDAGEPVDELVDQSDTMESPKSPVIENGIRGMVRYMELEGGFYGISGEDGNNYLPLNLDEAFKQDSLRVVFTMKHRKDVMSIAMWGQAVEITAIERIDE